MNNILSEIILSKWEEDWLFLKMRLLIQCSVNYHGKTCMHEKLHPKFIPMVSNIKSSLVRKMSRVPQYKMGIWDQIIRKEVSNLLPVNQTQAFFWAYLNSQIILKANMVFNILYGWEMTQTGSRGDAFLYIVVRRNLWEGDIWAEIWESKGVSHKASWWKSIPADGRVCAENLRWEHIWIFEEKQRSQCV